MGGIMRKIFQFLYIITFFTICIIPTVFFIYGNTNNNEAENRSREKMPSIVNKNKLNLHFPSEMESYFSENFGFRTKLVNIDAQLNYNLLGQSSSPKVIAGKEGWLFFNETLNDFTGRSLLSKQSLKQIVRTLELMNEYTESRGSSFYFTIAPNKNSIYPEYMPQRYSLGTLNNYWFLSDMIRYSDIKFIDLKAFLLDQKLKCNEFFYFKTDSHWNNLGTLRSYMYILTKTNNYFKTNIKTPDIYTKENTRTGDLYRMLFPEGAFKDEDFIYDIPKNYTSTKPFHEEDINIVTKLKKEETDINSGKKLLIFRDSFFNSLIKFVSNDFLEVKYSRQVPYPLDKINDEIVILEIAERNIPLLTKNAPIMPAPLRNNINLTRYDKLERKDIFFSKDEENEYFHLYGYYLNESYESDEVILKFGDNVFEAYPILEEKIKDDLIKKYGDKIINQGFSLRIPKDAEMDFRDFDVYVRNPYTK